MLKSVSGYPVPAKVLTTIAATRGLEASSEATDDVVKSVAYRLAKADVMMWVSLAPNVQQGGISYNMLDADRQLMRKQANSAYGVYGDGDDMPKTEVTYGYKGSRL